MFRNDFMHERSTDELFEQFVRELEAHSTNGVVKLPDWDRLWPLAQHYITQCERMEERVDLEERIRLLLASKFNYTLQESKLHLTEKLEKTIRQKIKELIKTNLDNAGKFAGLVMNWVIVRPFQIAKDLLQPVVTQTVLTYAVAIHPPTVAVLDVKPAEKTQPIADTPIEAVEETARNYEDIGLIKPYSEEVLDQLTSTENRSQIDEKSVVNQSIESKVKSLEPVITNTSSKDKLNVDVERAKQLAGTAIIMRETAISRLSREIRSVGHIQGTISLHETKIVRCYQSYKKTQGKKNGRIAVKMIVNPKGLIKDVTVTANSFNQEFANRVALQLKSIRFSEVDQRFGDQTVYHTFYF